MYYIGFKLFYIKQALHTFLMRLRIHGFACKSLLHLTLTPGSFLHGVTELRFLVLLLHLSVNLLHECSPLANLAGSLSSLGHLSCLGHYTYSEEINPLVRLTENFYIAWKHHLFLAAVLQMP